jgi:hypothetical protein
MPEADDTVKSSTTVGEAKGVGWCLEVENDQRKLDWWTKCAVGPMKKYAWEYEMDQKDRRRNTDWSKWKEKRNKNGGGFLGYWKLEIWFKWFLI